MSKHTRQTCTQYRENGWYFSFAVLAIPGWAQTNPEALSVRADVTDPEILETRVCKTNPETRCIIQSDCYTWRGDRYFSKISGSERLADIQEQEMGQLCL